MSAARTSSPSPARVRAFASARRRTWGAGASFGAAFERSGDPRDAYDAARAFDYVDPDRAWSFVERIPEAARADFPRLAWYEAKRALARGERGERLRPLFDALARYRESAEGRQISGIAATLVGLAGGVIFVRWMLRSLATTTLPDVGIDLYVSTNTVAVAVAVGIAVVALAPLLLVRRISRMDVPDALRIME